MGFETIEWGKLVDVKPIRSGGMAELFLAQRVSALGVRKPVVIKRIHQRLMEDTDSQALFVQEARIHSELNHPHIVQFYDLGCDQDYLYLALEYVEGGDLIELTEIIRGRDWVERAGLTLQLMQELAEAFCYLHERALHQDVSASNILYSKGGTFKLCDFGLSKTLGEAPSIGFRVGQGKFRYMSPEQLAGTTIDHRSDIFSLGLCAAELFSGKKLYAELPQKELLKLLRQGTYLKLIRELDLPVGLREIIERCVQPSPQDRFLSASQLLSVTATARSRFSLQFGAYCLRTTLMAIPPTSPAIGSGFVPQASISKKSSKTVTPRRISKLLTFALAFPILAFIPWIVRFRRYASSSNSRSDSQ